MCGINMVLHYPEDLAESIIPKMMEATHHRGPDCSRYMRVGHGTYLAGNRLKILDLSDRSNQPLVTADDNGILVWNGALYNFQDLRNELLSSGSTFNSQSDSEVLLNWLYVFGTEGLSRLSGMFSLIFVNKKDKTVLIARDSLGQKPLYYHQDGDKWLFSSELRGLLASGVIPECWNNAQYSPYFFFRHSSPSETFLVNIKQLLPGEFIVIDSEGELVKKDTLKVHVKPTALPDVGYFEELIVDSVLKHYHADVPAGIILSGGADSSLLYKALYAEVGIPLRSYTAVFEPKYQNRYPDFHFARTLAKKCHGKHEEVLITPEGFRRWWPEYVKTLDHPVGDTAGFLTWMIGRQAGADVKILIGGAGADELFGGYNRHKAFLLFLKHPKLAGFLRRFFRRMSIFPRSVQKAIDGIATTDMETYLNYAALQAVPIELQKDLNKWFDSEPTPFKAALNWDRTVYLAQDILKVFDSATMVHGIEGRSPYLDLPLVSLSMSLTEEQHRFLKPKQWINELLWRHDLGEIAGRKKLGFGLPIGEWLRDDISFRNEVFSTVKQFECSFGRDFPSEMCKLARKPEVYIKQSFLQIWNLYLLACWRETHNL